MNRREVIFLRKNDLQNRVAQLGSPEDILTFALESGMLELEIVRSEMIKARRDEFLSKHTHEIFQSCGRWYTYFDTEDGRVQRSRKTKNDLQNLIAEWYAERELNPTVRQIFDAWNDRKLELGKISPSTHYRNLGLYKRHMQNFGRKRIRSITEDDILCFLEEEVPKHNLSAKAFSNLKTLLRGIFKFARRKKLTDLHIESILRESDVTEIRFTRHIKDDTEEVYSEEESKRIFDYLVQNQDEVNICILLMFVTGMRVGEAVTLTHDDLGDTFVNVRRTESRYKDGRGRWQRTLKDFPKTMAGWRSIAVPRDYVWVIDKARNLHPFDNFVFPRKNNLWMSTFTVRTRLRAINDKLGIVQKSPHKIRKTYGSILLDAGVDQKIVMVQMGHADIITTERAYHRNRRTLDKRQEILSNIPDFRHATY